MKFGRWEVGQAAGVLILVCSFIHDKFGFAVPSALGAVLGYGIIAICFILEVIKNLKTGQVNTMKTVSAGGIKYPPFELISRSSSPTSFYVHIGAYILLAVYCSYFGFYYAYLFTQQAFA
jgi:hypothetical protein